MIGDLRSGALIAPDGAVEWGCFPRFDRGALFAALVGDETNGIWTLTTVEEPRDVSRRYEDGTLVLQTTFATSDGSAKVVDFMPVRDDASAIVRIVEGLDGTVAFRSHLSPRMKYGSLAPWTRKEGGAWVARVAPDGVCLRSTVSIEDDDRAGRSEFSVRRGERVVFVCQWFPASAPLPQPIDAVEALDETRAWWTEWNRSFSYAGDYRGLVLRSAIALKSLSSREHGSFVAALTMSLPEELGGDKNWDYRYTWLRDSSFASESLLRVGFHEEATVWRDWFLRTYAGHPQKLRIMYTVDGEYLADETQLPWLAGFAGSRPVRLRNGADRQFQLGIFGDLIGAFEHAQRRGLVFDAEQWSLIVPMLAFLEDNWERPGNGIWERRQGKQQYVDSKLMVWVAFDRALKMAVRGNLPCDALRWTELRDRVHAQICSAGYDPVRNTFTQYYGSRELDASSLLMLVFGFLPPEDPRMVGTVEAVERGLSSDGFVYRYTSDEANAPGKRTTEGTFTMCGFWLVQALVLIGRRTDAVSLFERLVASAGDLGLLSEEFSVSAGFAIGNYPQTFSHAGLIDAACALHAAKPA